MTIPTNHTTDAGSLTGSVLDADWEQAEAEASLRAARTLFLQVEILDGISESLSETAGDLADKVLQHLTDSGPYGYLRSEARVGEARGMLDEARRLVIDLRNWCGDGYETVMAEDAAHELEEHLARLERDDLRLRTEAAA